MRLDGLGIVRSAGRIGVWSLAGRRLVVQEDTEGGRLDVVELPVADRPAEGEHAETGEHERGRNEDVEDAHGRGGMNERCRIEEVTTTSDEMGMATAATSGVTSPATAAAAPPRL